jgi:porphobilinogen deaminase
MKSCRLLNAFVVVIISCCCAISTGISLVAAGDDDKTATISSTTTDETASLSANEAEQECVVDIDGQCQNADVETTKISEEMEPLILSADASLVTADANENKEEEGEEENEEMLDEVWLSGDLGEIGDHLQCPWNFEEEDSDSSLVEIHTEETWKLFNEIYNQVVDRELSSLPPQYKGSGFHVPIEVKYMPSVGRGVFAKEPIQKGQLVWKSINTAEFVNAQDYRDFLRKLPKILACDVLIWAYARKIAPKQIHTYKVCADLDEGSFVNHSSNRRKANAELGIGRLLRDDEDVEITRYGCDLEFYANREIKAGEEIRVDYDEFAERQGWRMMGL